MTLNYLPFARPRPRSAALWFVATLPLYCAPAQSAPSAPLWGEAPAASTKSVETAAQASKLPHFTAMGTSVAESLMLADLEWSGDELEAFILGIRAGYRGEVLQTDESTARFLDQINGKIQELKKQREEEYKNAMYQDLRQAFGLEQTDSGLHYRMVSGGSGPRPRKEDTVVLNLEARELDGATIIEPLTVKRLRSKVSDLLPGLREGVQLLTLGSQAVFMLPPELSFGNRSWPAGVRRGVPILFMVQLTEIDAGEKTP